MAQLFNDDRRKYKGYWIYFYSDEFEPVGTKSLAELHIHFFDNQGEIRVYLSDAKYLDISEKWGDVPNHNRTKIKKFVERYKQEIMKKIEDKLREIREKIK